MKKASNSSNSKNLFKIRMENLILPQDHYRSYDDDTELESFGDSLIFGKGDGYRYIHPLTVYEKPEQPADLPQEDKKYIISDGGLRYTAAMQKGTLVSTHKELRCVVAASKEEAMLISAKQNLCRKRVSPLQRAELLHVAYSSYKEKTPQATQQDFAKIMGMTDTNLSHYLGILKFPDSIKQELRSFAGAEISFRKLIRIIGLKGEKLIQEFQALCQGSADQTMLTPTDDAGDVVNREKTGSTPDKSSKTRERSSPFQATLTKLEDVKEKIVAFIDKGTGRKNTPLTPDQREALRERIASLMEIMRQLTDTVSGDQDTDAESESGTAAVAVEATGADADIAKVDADTADPDVADTEPGIAETEAGATADDATEPSADASEDNAKAAA